MSKQPSNKDIVNLPAQQQRKQKAKASFNRDQLLQPSSTTALGPQRTDTSHSRERSLPAKPILHTRPTTSTASTAKHLKSDHSADCEQRSTDFQ